MEDNLLPDEVVQENTGEVFADPDIAPDVPAGGVPDEPQSDKPPPVDQYKIGDVTISLPSGISDDQRQKAISAFVTSKEFEPHVDMETGAPARVRMIVGSSPDKDRLANIQKFYPDAIPYRDGNFLFTDPTTGKPTLYNPPGFDVVGDTASVAREATMGIASALGATAGTLGGMFTGVPGGPPGMIIQGRQGGAIGAGVGSAVGAELFDFVMDNTQGRIDTRTPVESTIDAGTEFFAAASGQKVGELAQVGISKAVSGPGKAAARKLADAFQRLEIDAPAGAVSGSKTIGTIEKALESSPLSADVMQKQAERILKQTKTAVDRIVAKIGTPRTKQGVGATVRDAAESAAERFGFTQDKAYDAAFDLIGPDTPVALNSISALRKEIERELARAPESLGPSLSKASRMLAQLEADGVEGLPFSALRQVRTNLGRDLSNPMLSGSTSSQNEALKRIYGALTEDMSATAKNAGPEAAKKLAVADRFTRKWMNTAAKTMNKIGTFDADEQAYRYAMSGLKDGGTTLSRMRQNFEPEEWDTIAASVLQRMGQARAGSQNAANDVFSVNTFMTNWSNMAPEAKAAMFGGKRYADLVPELETLVEVVSSLKGVERLTNTSNTAKNMIAWMTLQGIGGGLVGGIAGGDIESGAATAAASLLLPGAAAKLITNPKFVKWLTTPITETGGIPAHFTRLLAISEANPEISEEVESFLRALRAAPNN